MSFQNPIIHIVDDDLEIRAVYSILFEGIGFNVESYESAEEILQADLTPRVGCILLDYHLPKMNGLELQSELNNRSYQFPIIFMSGQPEITPAVDSVLGGALGYIQKPAKFDDIIEKVKMANARSEILFQQYQARMLLTKRETEIVDHLLSGKTNKVISDDIGISLKTVEFHRTNIMRKLGIRGVVELSALLG